MAKGAEPVVRRFALIVTLMLASCASPSVPPTVNPSTDQVSGTPLATGPAPVDGSLPVPGFVTINAAALRVRQGPGLDAKPVLDRTACIDNPNPCEQPFMLGADRGYLWAYVLGGPVDADGYEWYLVATEMNTPHDASLYPRAVGWVAFGDGEDAWLVPDERSCPSDPIELADVTNLALTKLEMLHCLGSRELTLHGWLPALGSSEDDSALIAECRRQHPWLTCGSLYDVIRPVSTGLGDPNYLEFVIDPDSGVVVPNRGQWVAVTGTFDHPDAQTCGDTAAVLICRFSFVLTSIGPQ